MYKNLDSIKLYNFVCKVCKEVGKPRPLYKEVAEYHDLDSTKQEYKDDKSDNESYLDWCKDTLDFNIRYE